MTTRERMAPLTVTEAAAQQIKTLMERSGKPAIGLRIGVSPKGCSGLSYKMEFAEERDPLDEVVETMGVCVLIDPKATMFILGTELDYVADKMQTGFVFRNPNEKGRCGCGESFHV